MMDDPILPYINVSAAEIYKHFGDLYEDNIAESLQRQAQREDLFQAALKVPRFIQYSMPYEITEKTAAEADELLHQRAKEIAALIITGINPENALEEYRIWEDVGEGNRLNESAKGDGFWRAASKGLKDIQIGDMFKRANWFVKLITVAVPVIPAFAVVEGVQEGIKAEKRKRTWEKASKILNHSRGTEKQVLLEKTAEIRPQLDAYYRLLQEQLPYTQREQYTKNVELALQDGLPNLLNMCGGQVMLPKDWRQKDPRVVLDEIEKYIGRGFNPPAIEQVLDVGNSRASALNNNNALRARLEATVMQAPSGNHTVIIRPNDRNAAQM